MKFRLRVHDFILFAEKYGIAILLSVLVFAFVCAVRDTYVSGPQELNFVWDAIWNTLDIPSRDASGWAKLMNVLGSITVAWAGVRIYMSAVGVKFDTFVAKHLMRSHIVIFAGESSAFTRTPFLDSSSFRAAQNRRGELAVELAIFLSKENRVLLCSPGLSDFTRYRLWESGVSVIDVDASTQDSLICAGTRRAKTLFAMREHYEENILLVRNAISLSGVDAGLSCHLMIEPLKDKNVFQIEDYFEADVSSRIRLFNESEIVARGLLSNFPPDECVSLASDKRVHLVLVGFGDLGEAILQQLARLGHYRSGLPPKVTVVAPTACLDIKDLFDRFPLLKSFIELVGCDVHPTHLNISSITNWFADLVSPTMIYVCTNSELFNLRISKLLVRFISDLSVRNCDVPFIVVLDPPGGSVLREFVNEPGVKNRISLFSVELASSTEDSSVLARSLLLDLDDSRAKKLHESYCQLDDLMCARDSARMKAVANRDWKLLPETIRNANRWSADHFDVKMRAIGLRISTSLDAINVELTAEEIEVLAVMEHNRWCAERLLDGWRFGDVRVDSLKIHHLLIPYDQLSEDDRKKDKENVLAVIRIVTDSEGALVRDV